MPRLTQAQERQQFMAALANLGTGTYSAYGDMFDWSMYDSFYLTNGTPEYRLFSVGIGEADPVTGNNKTLADTNMRGRTVTPKGSKMLVQYIKTFISSDILLDDATMQLMIAVLRNMVVNLSIFGKDTYGQWGLDELMNYYFAALNQPAVTVNTNPATQLRGAAVYPLKVPIVLASQTTFDIIVTPSGGQPDEALDDVKIKISLCGVLARLS